MKQRRTSLPLLVVVAVVALGLGSIGSAVAGPALTKGQVKKIAGKVVKKQAPGLSVGHAATADRATTATTATNATTLAGQAASAYLDNAKVYQSVKPAPSENALITIPLEPGDYRVSYSAFLWGAGPGNSGCYLIRYPPGGLPFAAFQTYADDLGAGQNPGHSASAVVSLAAGQLLSLVCFAEDDWTTYSGTGPDPIQIVVSELDSVTNGTLTAETRAVPRAARD
jgi:hypothetical protein